jgi:hypothetical protein
MDRGNDLPEAEATETGEEGITPAVKKKGRNRGGKKLMGNQRTQRRKAKAKEEQEALDLVVIDSAVSSPDSVTDQIAAAAEAGDIGSSSEAARVAMSDDLEQVGGGSGKDGTNMAVANQQDDSLQVAVPAVAPSNNEVPLVSLATRAQLQELQQLWVRSHRRPLETLVVATIL